MPDLPGRDKEKKENQWEKKKKNAGAEFGEGARWLQQKRRQAPGPTAAQALRPEWLKSLNTPPGHSHWPSPLRSVPLPPTSRTLQIGAPIES